MEKISTALCITIQNYHITWTTAACKQSPLFQPKLHILCVYERETEVDHRNWSSFSPSTALASLHLSHQHFILTTSASCSSQIPSCTTAPRLPQRMFQRSGDASSARLDDTQPQNRCPRQHPPPPPALGARSRGGLSAAGRHSQMWGARALFKT